MEFQSYRGGLLYPMVSGCFEWSFRVTEGVCFTPWCQGVLSGVSELPRGSALLHGVRVF